MKEELTQEDRQENKPKWYLTTVPKGSRSFGFWVGIVPQMGGDLVFNCYLYFIHFGYAW